MNKLIVIFVLLNLLNIYYQLDCEDYTDTTCGGYSSYKLKCHKSGSNCIEIEIDDGCTIDSTGCVAENGVKLAQNEKCFDYGESNKCRRIKHQCTSYIDETCGGLKGITNSVQCIKMASNDFCTEIKIDDYCQIDEDSKDCKKSQSVKDENFDNKYSCVLNTNENTCKRISKVCSEQDEENCEEMTPSDDSYKCKKVIIGSSSTCKEIQETSECTVTNTICSGVPADTSKKCGFDKDITTCGPISKTCEDYDSENCSGKSVVSTGKTCSKVNGVNKCKEVQIDRQCTINTDGNCALPADVTTHACVYDNDKTVCKQISICENTDAGDDGTACDGKSVSKGECSKVIEEVKCKEVRIDAQCKIDGSFKCVDNALNDNSKICDFNDDKTTCEPRSKTCEEYENDKCSGKTVVSTGKTCSKVKGEDNCKEVTIDIQCTIDNNGDCKLINTYKSGSCDFNGDKNECKYKPCSANSEANCDNVKGCRYYSGSCREITVGTNCQVSSGVCSDTDSPASTATTACLFDYEITECKKREKICSNYFDNNCGNIEITSTKQCYKFSNSNTCKEISVDDKCNVISDQCKERTGVSDIPENKICGFTDTTKTSCKLIDKKCEQYETETCKDLTYSNSNKKCFYYSSSCHEVELDKYCTVDESGECVGKGDSSLSDTEKCEYTDTEKKECKKRKMVCSELSGLDDDICENYKIINNKFCFKFDDLPNCKEVIVEDGCKMNSSNKCVAKNKGDGCTLDENKNRCYKTKSGASLLNLKIFSLLILFFIC